MYASGALAVSSPHSAGNFDLVTVDERRIRAPGRWAA